MVNAYECALFCDLIYRRTDDRIRRKLPQGWIHVETSPLTNTGTKCIALLHEERNELIFVIRGSRVVENWITNFAQLVPGRPAACYPEVRRFFERISARYPHYNITFTGHSLGAYLAELCACQYLCRAITFESPGCREVAELLGLPWQDAQVTSYLSAPNIVNTLYAHIGKMIRVYVHHTSTHGYDFDELNYIREYFSSIKGLFLSGGFSALLGVNLKHLRRIHDMSLMYNSFEPLTAEPILFRCVYEWPSNTDYLNSLETNFTSILSAPLEPHLVPRQRINQDFESKIASLPHYVVSTCQIADRYLTLSENDKLACSERILLRFDDFFSDYAQRTELMRRLNYRDEALRLPHHLQIGERNMKVEQVGVTAVGAAAGAGTALTIGAVSAQAGLTATLTTKVTIAATATTGVITAPLWIPLAAVGAGVGGICALTYCINKANDERERLQRELNEIRAQQALENQANREDAQRREEALNRRVDDLTNQVTELTRTLAEQIEQKRREDAAAEERRQAEEQRRREEHEVLIQTMRDLQLIVNERRHAMPEIDLNRVLQNGNLGNILFFPQNALHMVEEEVVRQNDQQIERQRRI